jgi:hypothetical protein
MTTDCSLRIEDSPQLAAESVNVLVGGGNDINELQLKLSVTDFLLF